MRAVLWWLAAGLAALMIACGGGGEEKQAAKKPEQKAPAAAPAATGGYQVMAVTNGGTMRDYRGFGKASRPMLPSIPRLSRRKRSVAARSCTWRSPA